MFIVQLIIFLTFIFQHSETKLSTVHVRNRLRKRYNNSSSVAEKSLKKNNVTRWIML